MPQAAISRWSSKTLVTRADVVLAGAWDTDCTLTADINLQGKNWTPVGNQYKNNGYEGKFDGNGYTISNLNIDTSNDDVGLFGYVDNDGIVQNVNLTNVKVSGQWYVGGVVGDNGSGSITACYWQKGPDLGVGQNDGIGTLDVKQIKDDVTIQDAIDAMNKYLTDYQYKWEGSQIVLVANSSNTTEVSGLTQKVLDAARAIGL